MPEKNFPRKSWTLACFWGWLAGIVLILLFSGIVEALGTDDLQFHIGLLMGIGVGFTQWLWLKKRFNASSVWLLSSAAGMTVPFLLTDFFRPAPASVTLPLSVIAGGLFTGWLQSRLLKTYSSLASAWIICSFMAWTLAACCVLLVNCTMALKATGLFTLLLAFLNLLLILSGGWILGLVSGRVLQKILSETSVAKSS